MLAEANTLVEQVVEQVAWMVRLSEMMSDRHSLIKVDVSIV